MIHKLHMIERQLHPSILEHLAHFPAVALLGARQVGKTTLAEVICGQHPGCIYLDLESPIDRNKLVDPEAYLARFEDKLVILDEVQRLAHHPGGLLNVSQLSRNLGIDAKTVGRYLDWLVDLFLVRRLMPWHGNTGKRLVKSPEIYIRDSGLVHALLGIGHLDGRLGHPVVGSSWEGFVIENLLNAAPFNTTASFYRTGSGAEIDLLLDIPGQGLWVMEIKRGMEARPKRGFYQACADLQAARRFMVYPGSDRYPLGDGVEAIGLQTLLAQLSA